MFRISRLFLARGIADINLKHEAIGVAPREAE